MSKKTKTIEVTECRDCPLYEYGSNEDYEVHLCNSGLHRASPTNTYVSLHYLCPLKKQSITIKIKE